LGFVIFESEVASAGNIIYVGSGPGNNTTSIQDAIDNFTNPGDTVFVWGGTYLENVWVNKTINLIGEDRTTTIIDGGGSGDVVYVTANWVNITGFTITNSGSDWGGGGYNDAGIELYNVQNCKVFDNAIYHNGWLGIYLYYSDWNTIIDNIVTYNHDIGIFLWYSSNDIIADNKIYSNDENGIKLFFSSNNAIIDNNVSSNVFHGIYLQDSNNNNLITDNIVLLNGLHGIWLDHSNGNHIIGNNVTSNNWDGISIFGSSNNTIIGNSVCSNIERGLRLDSESNNNLITDNNISNNRDGIYLYLADWNNILCNNVSNNNDGIYFELLSNNNTITDNDVSANGRYGIYFQSSSNNNIIGNNVSSNDWNGILFVSSINNNIKGNIVFKNADGISLQGSSNNRIYHNNILNNTNQAYDDTNNGNQWDNDYPSGGNFWSDFNEPSEGAYDYYQGLDQNFMGSDGIVDLGLPSGGKNPYIIDGDSQDNYPLIKFVAHLFLYEGWNLISIPYIQPDTNLDIVLNSIKGSYDAVQWYNVSDNSDPWKHSSIKKLSHLNDLDDIHHKMGFWIHITQPGRVLFQYFGIPPTENQSITLHPGWNLVGYPSLISYNRTQGLNNLTFGTDVDSIWTYNAATQKWEGIEESDYFEIGRGYWIHSKVKKTWEVPL
jgi:nitrous oxidase accessory protein